MSKFATSTRIAVQPSTVALAAGELVALVGPNGAGKSSSAARRSRVSSPHAGTVTWCGTALDAARRQRRARARSRILPQDAAPCTGRCAARDLVALGRLPHRAYGAERERGRRRAAIARRDARRRRRLAFADAQRGPAVRRRTRTRAARARARGRRAGAARRRADRDARSRITSSTSWRCCAPTPRAAPRRGSSSPCCTTSVSPRGSATRVLLLNDGAVVDDGPPERRR